MHHRGSRKVSAVFTQLNRKSHCLSKDGFEGGTPSEHLANSCCDYRSSLPLHAVRISLTKLVRLQTLHPKLNRNNCKTIPIHKAMALPVVQGLCEGTKNTKVLK